ncbi:MAG: hypothetical protein U0V49_10555 [Saprospiraceae bacterium]
MKNQFILFLAAFAIGQLSAQTDSTGLPGDFFSLQGALEIFKQSESPEEFEKLLNRETSKVSNLDLDNDGEVDYIKVIEKMNGDAHVFVLQIAVSEKENQDIAAIELEKVSNTEANIQIVGDDFIFGEEKIVEPSDGTEEEMEDSKGGPSPEGYFHPAVVINVWPWPCVRFVYAPAYKVWVSPWRWRAYPGWYRPWRPLTFAVWHPFRARYYGPAFRVVHTHRLATAHRIYTPVRVHSKTVHTRYEGAHKTYHVTKHKTTVTGPRGNKVTKTNTTVRGPHGHVKAEKTTVTRSRRR